MADDESLSWFRIGQRFHAAGNPHRTGTIRYIGPVSGYSASWIGVDWDDGEGKHDGSLNGSRYFHARSDKSGSFVRAKNLSAGISFIEALFIRYRSDSTKEEEDEMYVLSTRNKRVSVQLVGKHKVEEQLKNFEDLIGALVSYMGVSSIGSAHEINALVPNLKELDLTGNLLSKWQVEKLKPSLHAVEELHLMANQLGTITTESSATGANTIEGFDSLRLLNLEDNCINSWDEIVKLSHLRSLEQLHLNKNKLKHIYYPAANHSGSELARLHELQNRSFVPFEKLECLLLGCNEIEDLLSIDSLNAFPSLVDIRLSENPIGDPAKGGVPRFVLVARLAKVKVLNGSEVSARERKESEIRYVRLVMAKLQSEVPQEIKWLHPRYFELKALHGIDDEKPSNGPQGPQKMASGLLSISLKCVGASIGEKLPLTKKMPPATTSY